MRIRSVKDELRSVVRTRLNPFAPKPIEPKIQPILKPEPVALEPQARDPFLEWGKKFLEFHSWQVSSGAELLRQGIPAQTAGELDNLRAAQQHNQMPYSEPMPVQEPMPMEPWNPFQPQPGMDPMNPMGPGPMPGA